MSYRRKHKYHYKEEKRTQIVFSAEPLSLAGPSSIDIKNEHLLTDVLGAAGRLKENRASAQQREYVLQELNEICQDWIRSSARKHGHPEEFISNSRVRLYAFGSYKLDVHSLGDDVDLLCVGPNFLTRDMFFSELGIEILSKLSSVTQFYAVPRAYVPVMSFKYNGIDIDLVYAQLQIELLDSDWDINDDRNLRNLEFSSILSLNGVRLAHRTLELVPNKDVFRLSLRAIRYWAKQRGIYSNKLGYLGGVSWAILCARVCQLYPAANASQIVQNFFLFYHIWNFGTPLKAITLCNIVQHEDMPSIKVWDPNDQSAKYELMHIITPAFPAMNSTHNVSQSTFRVLNNEIARAFHLLSRAKRNIDGIEWEQLFGMNTFFMDHRNYIFVKACAPKKHLTEWSGLIESKIRSFVNNLEVFSDHVSVTPFCKAIRLKLTQDEIDGATNPQILAEIKLKRARKKKEKRAKKLKLKREKLEEIRLQKLHLKLQKERQIAAEEAAAAVLNTNNININDGEEEEKEETEETEETEESKKTIKTIKKEEKENIKTDENQIMIVSNLALRIETKESKSPSLNSVSLSPNKSPSNPYIYVAPGLQSKYTFKSRKYNVNRRNAASLRYNRVTTTTTTTSATLSEDENKNKEDSVKEESVKQQKEEASAVSLPNPHAFVVGKGQIACCQSFNNRMLSDKASKKYTNDRDSYLCRAFVIGLNINNNNKKEETDKKKERFDFSRSVLQFMKGLNHIYTDAHLIIELISCNKIAHYLFASNLNRRPSKAEIIQHQLNMDKLHKLWKSKRCTATLDDDEQKALNSPATQAASDTFDADDTLMNDNDEMDAYSMPGLQINKEKEREKEEICIVNEPSIKKRKLMNGKIETTIIINNKEREKEESQETKKEEYLNPYYSQINWSKKVDDSPTYSYALRLYRESLEFSSWNAVCHQFCANATHVYNTCKDQSWKIKLKKLLSNEKYCWNGCKFEKNLNSKLMNDLAHDIVFNYMLHKNLKKKRKLRTF